MMTEREAWSWLAERWDAAREEVWMGIRQHITNVLQRDKVLGLCCSIDAMYDADKINGKTANLMNKRIREARVVERPYLWPRDAAGARSRADFCRQQAASLQVDGEQLAVDQSTGVDQTAFTVYVNGVLVGQFAVDSKQSAVDEYRHSE